MNSDMHANHAKQAEKEVKEDFQRELRDKFAMAALPAVIDKLGFGQYADLTDSIVNKAYTIADAMLKRRQQ